MDVDLHRLYTLNSRIFEFEKFLKLISQLVSSNSLCLHPKKNVFYMYRRAQKLYLQEPRLLRYSLADQKALKYVSA